MYLNDMLFIDEYVKTLYFAIKIDKKLQDK